MNLNDAIERLRDQCRLQHLQWNTEQAYIGWLVRFARYLSAQPVAVDTPAAKLEAFLTHLERVENVAPSTQNPRFDSESGHHSHDQVWVTTGNQNGPVFGGGW